MAKGRTENAHGKINIEELADIRDVEVKTHLPQSERIKDYIEQIKNPYLFRCGDIVIQIEHINEGITLEDCLREYARKRGL